MKVGDIFRVGGGHHGGDDCGCYGGRYRGGGGYDGGDGERRGRRRDREEILELLGIPIIGEGGGLLHE